MVSSSASAILRLAGWSYLPDWITQTALGFIHRSYTVVTGRPAPKPQTPTYARNYRYTFAVGVLGYLIYNMVEASRSMEPNYYELLGVYPNADEASLKMAFRAFARRNHPDKVGPSGEALFIEVRNAYDALKNPVTRYAYDRFGASALGWKCTTIMEYLHQGLTQSIGFHLVSGAILLIYSAIGAQSAASFWRYTLFFALMAAELALILGPSVTTSNIFMPNTSSDPATPSGTTENLLVYIFPRRVSYQHILFLHQLFMFLSVAVSRVAPVLFPPTIDDIDGIGMSIDALEQMVSQISMISAAASREVGALLSTNLHSMHFDPSADDGIRFGTVNSFPRDRLDQESMELLKDTMVDVLIESRLRKAASEPGPLRKVFDSAVARVRNAVAMRGRPAASRKISTRTQWWERRRPSEAQVPQASIDLTMDQAARLPSPISATASEQNLGHDESDGKLPSPQASPPPRNLALPGMRSRRESYVRLRSQSC